MKEPMTANARIESTMIGVEDHGILTAFVHLNYGGSAQGFGGYSLDEPFKKDKKFGGRRGTAYGMEWIRRVLEVVGVEKWEDLEGRHVRVVYDYGKVYKIGHIIEDKWFDPEELWNSMKVKSSER